MDHNELHNQHCDAITQAKGLGEAVEGEATTSSMTEWISAAERLLNTLRLMASLPPLSPA